VLESAAKVLLERETLDEDELNELAADLVKEPPRDPDAVQPHGQAAE
jgi:hypothetical protein